MPTIAAGSRLNITLAAGYRFGMGRGTGTYRVGPLAGSTRPTIEEAIDPDGTWIGPFEADCAIAVIATSAVTYNAAAPFDALTQSPVVADAAGLLYAGGSPVSGAGNRVAYAQIPVAPLGDSIANISAFANQDLRQITGTFGQAAERMGVALNALSGGAIRVVANCGVSGETTAQMLARDAAGSSSTRKALTDAQATGARYVVFSAGINDGQGASGGSGGVLPGGSSSATIDSAVAGSIANLKALCKRTLAMGMIPIVPALLGYSYAPGSGLGTDTLANVTTTQEYIRRWNSAAKAMIDGAAGALGYFVDSFRSSIVDANGAWLPGLDQGDGLHPGFAGCNLIYAPVAALILQLDGCSGTSPLIYPVGLPNLFANADFSAASSGTATGANIYQTVGSVTIAKSIVDLAGTNWQEISCTPTALDGNGNAGVEIDLTYTASGVSAADVLGGEISIYIDDGNGGPATNVFQHCVRLRSNGTYADSPLFNPTISPKVGMKTVLNRRVSTQPIVAPATPTTNPLLSVILVCNSLTPFRLRVARPRVVKLPSTY